MRRTPGAKWAARAGLSLVAASPQPALSAVTPADLVETADIGGLSVSPSGEQIAFRVERARIETNTHVSDWFVADPEAGTVRPIGGGGTPIFVDPGVSLVETPVWSVDGTIIYYRALVDDAVALWQARADGEGARRVVRDDADIISFDLAEDGAQLIYRVGATRATIRDAEQAEYDAGIRLDASVDLAQSIFRGAIVNGRKASQRLTGNWFERAPLLWRHPTADKRYRLASGTVEQVGTPGKEVLRGGAEPIGGRLVATSASGRSASLVQQGGMTVIEVAAQRGGVAPTRCEAVLCRDQRIDWIAWRPGAEELIYATRDLGQAQSLHSWDVASNSVRTIARGEGLLSGSREPWTPCAIARRHIVCVAASATSPPRLEDINLESGARTLLYDPNEALRSRYDVRATALEWTGPGGEAFTAVLMMPPVPGEGPHPLFISYYSCEGFLRGGVGDEWPLASFAGAGIATLCVNRTAAGGLDSAEEHNDAALTGLSAIVDRLAGRRLIDPGRVGMGGLSFGASAALWIAFQSNLLAALSLASPSLEPSYYWFNGFRGRDAHERLRRWWRLNDPADDRRAWQHMSPALNTGRITAALLMQLSEQEARLGTEFIGRMSLSATPSEFYAFPDEPHIKVQPRHKLSAYRRNLDWFRYWLQDFRDADPGKSEQYERWDAMRPQAARSAHP